LKFPVLGSRFAVLVRCAGFSVRRFTVPSSEFRVAGCGFRVRGWGFRVR
jgi:hypothetical protein